MYRYQISWVLGFGVGLGSWVLGLGRSRVLGLGFWVGLVLVLGLGFGSVLGFGSFGYGFWVAVFFVILGQPRTLIAEVLFRLENKSSVSFANHWRCFFLTSNQPKTFWGFGVLGCFGQNPNPKPKTYPNPKPKTHPRPTQNPRLKTRDRPKHKTQSPRPTPNLMPKTPKVLGLGLVSVHV